MAGPRHASRSPTRSRTPAAYDVVAFFDALHDLGDPVGAARHARAALAPDGICVVVEPFAGDRIEDNLTPVGRFFYGISTLVCTPGSLSQPGRAGARDAGRRGAPARCARSTAASRPSGAPRETPFNLVLEARGQSIVS